MGGRNGAEGDDGRWVKVGQRDSSGVGDVEEGDVQLRDVGAEGTTVGCGVTDRKSTRLNSSHPH